MSKFKREAGIKYGKVLLSPIKKRNIRKSKTLVNLPLVQSRQKELQAQLEQLHHPFHAEDVGEGSSANALAGADGNFTHMTEQMEDGNESPSANMDEALGPAQAQAFDDDIQNELVIKTSKENSQAAAMALHRQWEQLLPTLHQPLLDFISRTTGHAMLPLSKSDLASSCPQPGICTIKQVPVLCLFLDRASITLFTPNSIN
jgi:hypothetical protein